MQIVRVAKNTFRESVRDRVLFNLIGFAILMIGSSLLVGELAIGDQQKVITDIGLSAMRFVGMVIAIFIGIQLVYKEMERKTIFGLLSKPLRRSQLVIGKFVGLGLTLATNSAVMLAAVMLSVAFVKGGYAVQIATIVPATYLILLELIVTTAVALMFSTISSPALSAMLSLLIYIAGNFAENLRLLAQSSDSAVAKTVLTLTFYLIPNFAKFSAISSAAYGRFVPVEALLAATAYAVVYCALVLSIAVLVFERRDFK